MEPWNTPPSGTVLFQDDFSDQSSNWLPTVADAGLAGYFDGTLRFLVYQPEVDIWSTPGLNFEDARIEVNVTRLAGPEENRMGVICRYQGPRDFYFFVISSDGYYGVGKVTQNVVSLIGQEQMQYSAAIQTGGATNHLQADCVGQTMTFYVNNLPVALVKDSDHQNGDVGLLAGTFKGVNVDVTFDNFMVIKP